MCYIYSKLLEIVDILAYMSVIEPNLEQMLVNYKPICKKPNKNCYFDLKFVNGLLVP